MLLHLYATTIDPPGEKILRFEKARFSNLIVVAERNSAICGTPEHK
jgi:hypothetical protein